MVFRYVVCGFNMYEAGIDSPFVVYNQAIIFIIKREFMLIGWMVIYILA